MLDKPAVDEEDEIVAATTEVNGGETKGKGIDGVKGIPDAWEIGYTLSEPYRGRGLLKTAVTAVLEGWVKWTGIKKVVGVSTAHSSS